MKLFNIDGKFAHVMSRIFDLAVLNFLFLLTSIPLFTIGTSCSALYTVTLAMSQNCDSYIFKSYFKYWKAHAKRGTLLWMALLLFGGFIILDRFLITYMNHSFQYFQIFFSTLLLLWSMTASYVFPLLAYFNSNFRQTLKNALFMSIRHLPWTLLILAIHLLPVISIAIFPPILSALMLFFLITVGFAALALLNSYIFEKRIFPVYEIDPAKPERI